MEDCVMIEAATRYEDVQGADERKGYKKTLDWYKRQFAEYRSTTETNRTQVLIDYDYYDGKQLTPAEREILRARNQPDIVINRFKVAINGILGVTARTHTDPRCFPRTPDDESSADIATDVLRYAVETNGFKFEKTSSMKDYLVGGTCAMLIGVDKDRNIKFQTIRWEEFFVDPRSRRPDCKDARYMGIAKWMFQDEVPGMTREQQATGEEAGGATGAPGMVDESFDDRPINEGWMDARSRRVLVVEMYHKCEGSWYKCLFYYGGILEEVESPYLDEKGRPCNPIEAQSCYVDRDNNRYGHGRDMRDLQDEINKRRSKMLHLANSSQIQARDASAIEVDADTARLEAAKPDGVLPFGWERVNLTDMSQGQMYLLTEAKSEMERFGPNPAVLGRQGSDSSGRALLARQQAGMIELGVIFDQFENWELRVYKQAWARAKQYWTAPMYIRLTGDQDDPQFLGINQPKGEPILGPDGQPQMGQDGQPMEGEPQTYPDKFPDMIPTSSGEIPHPYGGQAHPKAGESVFGYKNVLAEMDVDIIIDTAPETANIMAEQLKDLIALVGSSPAYAQQVPFELFLEMTPMPRKRQFIAKVKKFREEGQAQQQGLQKMQMQAQMQELAAKIKKIMSGAGLDVAKAQQAAADADLAIAQAAATLASAHLTAEEAHATAAGVALDAADQVHSHEMDRQQMAADQATAQQPEGPGEGA
jgi:hypothetical protein